MSTFPQPLLDSLAADPRHTVIEHGERKVSSAELLSTVRRMVGTLRAHDLGHGSGVAMLTGVTPEALAAYLAANVLGCRVIGIRPGYSERQLAHLLSAGVDAVVTDGTLTQLDEGTPVEVAAAGRQDDPARLVYPSGGTGMPKGCVQTYRAMSAHWSWTPGKWDDNTTDLARHGERYLLSGTLASAVVQDHAVLALHGGGTVVIPDRDEPLPYAVRRHGITGTVVNVPRLYQLLDVIREHGVDAGSLKALVVTGSPLPPHRLWEAVDLLGPVVYQAYGQNETGNVTVLTPAHIVRYGVDVLSSVGRPHSHVDVDVRDGELYVRTDYQMSGYWQDEARTADVLVDGWVRTRDVGYLDGNGFVHLTGRAREVLAANALRASLL